MLLHVIKPAVVQVRISSVSPRMGSCSTSVGSTGIVLLAFASLGHGMEPKVLEDPVIRSHCQTRQQDAGLKLRWHGPCSVAPRFS